MNPIAWTEEYSVGVHILDADHRMIIDLINQVASAVHAGPDHAKVAHALETLCEYTEFHFAREEAIMEAVGYSDLPGHYKVHEKLRAQVDAIRDRHKANPNTAMDVEVMTFLNAWLFQHILGHDMHYAPFMVGKEMEIAKAHRNLFHPETVALSADATG